MKKLILSAAVIAAAVFGIFKVHSENNINSDNMNALQIENVEILAEGESSGPCCYQSCDSHVCLVFDGYDLIFQQAGFSCSGSCGLKCITGNYRK